MKTAISISQSLNIIEEAILEEFIIFAKAYNIFQVSSNEFYNMNCKRIRDRLEKENLTEDDLK